jgi:hypothetical protein
MKFFPPLPSGSAPHPQKGGGSLLPNAPERPQVIEKLHGNPGNTNVTEVTGNARRYFTGLHGF